MADELHIFFDFDDTLSDLRTLGGQYVSTLAGMLACEFGGDPAAWAAAVQPALADSIARYTREFTGNPLGGYRAWIGDERPRVARGVFAAGGIEPPASELAELSLRLQTQALTRCNAFYAGAAQAVSALAEAGVQVHMASSQESAYLIAATSGSGFEQHVQSWFGPDLIDCAKEGPEYYRRIFEKLGIHPRQAVVVDDQAICLDFAEEAGAYVIQALVRPEPPEAEFPVTFRTHAELPDVIRRVTR